MTKYTYPGPDFARPPVYDAEWWEGEPPKRELPDGWWLWPAFMAAVLFWLVLAWVIVGWL